MPELLLIHHHKRIKLNDNIGNFGNSDGDDNYYDYGYDNNYYDNMNDSIDDYNNMLSVLHIR